MLKRILPGVMMGFSPPVLRAKEYAMLGSVGMPELIVIFVIALVVFGPRKLPELGRSLGKAIAEFKRATNDLQTTLEEEIRADEQRVAHETSAPAAPSVPTSATAPASVEKAS